MKQLDIVVTPSAFVCDPCLTLAHMTFDRDLCAPTSTGSSVMIFFPSKFFSVDLWSSDGQMKRNAYKPTVY